MTINQGKMSIDWRLRFYNNMLKLLFQFELNDFDKQYIGPMLTYRNVNDRNKKMWPNLSFCQWIRARFNQQKVIQNFIGPRFCLSKW